MEDKTLRVTIPGVPIAKGRPRSVRRGAHIGTYTPKKTADWSKHAVGVITQAARGMDLDHLQDGPLALYLLTVAPRPKRLMRKKDLACRIPMDRKPDMDNLEKAVLDAIVKSSVVRDDSQFCHGMKWHWYAAKNNDEPMVHFVVAPWAWNGHWTSLGGSVI